VELSGLVIEHERGYRAEKARMLELRCSDPELVEALSERFPQVPVVLTPGNGWRRR
jgi:hypothetical protein